MGGTAAVVKSHGGIAHTRSRKSHSPQRELKGRNVSNLAQETAHPTQAKKASDAVLKYIKAHRSQIEAIFANLAAWGLIIVCSGLLYGFEAVALPLTIGIASGVAFGIVLGVFTCKFFDPENKYRGKNSCWGLINSALESLKEEYGSRSILVPVAVTVLLSAAVIFPIAMGVLFGILLGNQLAISVGYDDKLPKAIAKLKKTIDKANHDIEDIDSKFKNNKISSIQIETMISTCDREVKSAFDECVLALKLDKPVETFPDLYRGLKFKAQDQSERDSIRWIKVHQKTYLQQIENLRLKVENSILKEKNDDHETRLQKLEAKFKS